MNDILVGEGTPTPTGIELGIELGMFLGMIWGIFYGIFSNGRFLCYFVVLLL